MRTMFGRTLTLTMTLLLMAWILFGFAFRTTMRQYLLRETQETLYSDASAVCALAAAYNATGDLAHNWDFRIALSFAADLSEVQALICSEEGEVVLCSCEDNSCSFIGRAISPDLLKSAQAEGHYYEYGTLSGMFDTGKLVICMPIISETSGEQTGSVIIASEREQIDLLLSETTTLVFLTAIIVMIVAVLATGFFASRQTKPLNTLAAAAREFGHGNLHARMPVEENYTEEVKDLAAAFNNMAVSIEKSESQRREFVANVSHELKTPMTTISGFMDGMLDGTIPPEQHRRYMQRVSDEVRRLSRLVRNMLEVSRIQDQGFSDAQKQKFDICEAIGGVLLTFEQRINTKRLHVEVQMPPNGIGVFAALDPITQVLYNLLDNAVKFSDEGGSIFVQVESDGVRAEVSIANTGRTIPEEELPLVFDRFHKTDKSRSQDREGAGLGLYIVKTIVAGHGEDISVTSRDEVTRFTFTLPVK